MTNELWYANGPDGMTYRPFIPTIPHTAAGIRTEPPPSEPKATGHKPININSNSLPTSVMGLQCTQRVWLHTCIPSACIVTPG